MIADKLLSRLQKVKPRGDGSSWTACCPAHDDKSPSLLVTERDDCVLVHCRAGCGGAEIVAAAGLQFADLYPERQDDKTSMVGRDGKYRYGGRGSERYSTRPRKPFDALAVLQSLSLEAMVVSLAAQLVQQHYEKILEEIPEERLVKWFDIGLSRETYERVVLAANRLDAGRRLADGQY